MVGEKEKEVNRLREAIVPYVETEYREILFQLETEHSDMGLYQIIAQSRPVQMISY